MDKKFDEILLQEIVMKLIRELSDGETFEVNPEKGIISLKKFGKTIRKINLPEKIYKEPVFPDRSELFSSGQDATVNPTVHPRQKKDISFPIAFHKGSNESYFCQVILYGKSYNCILRYASGKKVLVVFSTDGHPAFLCEYPSQKVIRYFIGKEESAFSSAPEILTGSIVKEESEFITELEISLGLS